LLLAIGGVGGAGGDLWAGVTCMRVLLASGHLGAVLPSQLSSPAAPAPTAVP